MVAVCFKIACDCDGAPQEARSSVDRELLTLTVHIARLRNALLFFDRDQSQQIVLRCRSLPIVATCAIHATMSATKAQPSVTSLTDREAKLVVVAVLYSDHQYWLVMALMLRELRCEAPQPALPYNNHSPATTPTQDIVQCQNSASSGLIRLLRISQLTIAYHLCSCFRRIP